MRVKTGSDRRNGLHVMADVYTPDGVRQQVVVAVPTMTRDAFRKAINDLDEQRRVVSNLYWEKRERSKEVDDGGS